MEPLISILHATRGRFELFWRAYDWAVDRAVHKNRLEYIICGDEDDPVIYEIKKALESGGRVKVPTKLIIGPKDQGNNGAWNRAAQDATGKVLLQLSDDFECLPEWDATVLERLNNAGGLDKPLVLGVGDPHFTPPYSGDGLLSIYICTKAYMDKCGYFLYPEYPSVFSDTELAQKAAMDDCLVDAYDFYFLHHWHGGPEDPRRDETYCRHLTTQCNDRGRQIFGNRLWQGCPDILVADPNRDMDAVDEYLAPIGHPQFDAIKNIVAQFRKLTDRMWIKNKPFPETDFRRAWMEGRWKEAREGAVVLMNKYHLKACGSRFLAHGLHHIHYYCCEMIGDRPGVGVREIHV